VQGGTAGSGTEPVREEHKPLAVQPSSAVVADSPDPLAAVAVNVRHWAGVPLIVCVCWSDPSAGFRMPVGEFRVTDGAVWFKTMV
jgi:hypothetical protein